MSRTPDVVLDELISLLPPGWAMPKRGSDFVKKLQAMADGIAIFEEAIESFAPEINPLTANFMLADYERVLGADPCGRETINDTTAVRQQIAYQRWTARGGQSAQYFIDLAASLGVPITIETFQVSEIGVLECGDELIGHPQQFYWLISLPLNQSFDFIVGEAECDDPLGWFTPNLVECYIRRQAPAHTIPVFNYV